MYQCTVVGLHMMYVDGCLNFVSLQLTLHLNREKKRDKKLMFIYYLRSTAPALLMYGYTLSMFINRCCNYFSLLTVFF